MTAQASGVLGLEVASTASCKAGISRSTTMLVQTSINLDANSIANRLESDAKQFRVLRWDVVPSWLAGGTSRDPRNPPEPGSWGVVV